MNNDCKRKVCVITGATRGLGYALAKKYNSEGFDVIGLASNQVLLEAMIKRRLLKEFIVCDLADSNSITKAIREIKSSTKSSAPGYCASKAALASWVNSLRVDVQCYDITVSEIIPGLIKTDMSEEAKEKGVDPKVLADWIYTTRKGGVCIGPGARLGWWIHRIIPNVFSKLMLSM